MRKREVVLFFVMGSFLLSGCHTTNQDIQQNTDSTASESTSATEIDTSAMFSDRDKEVGYEEEESVAVLLADKGSSCESDSVSIDENVVTITEEGTYILSGSLSDGMVIVDAEDTDKIQLVLDDVSISNSQSAALYIRSADKVFVTTAAGTENELINLGTYIAIDENNIDAAVFSKSDLTLNGEGILTVTAQEGHGIVSKDDLVFTSGDYTITSAKHGISGKDSVRIANGSYKIISGKDGIHGENTEDSSLGFVYLAGGTFDITSQQDGVSAGAWLQAEEGTYTIVAGEGSAGVQNQELETKMLPEQLPQDTTEENTTSIKGMKASAQIVLKGGKGGLGNQHFATSTMQVPKYAQPGQPAQELEVLLELKVIADVGLVGFPNVGKSTFLSRVTNAQPKIANYHFTTLSPNLGVVDTENGGFVIADIPGLIEGASEGVGLGHEFLRHIERTKVIIHIVDAAGTEGRDPIQDIYAINKELEAYNPEIAARPQVIAANKIDAIYTEDGSDPVEAIRAEFEPKGIKVFPMSAVTGQGVKELLYEVNEMLQGIGEETTVFAQEYFPDSMTGSVDDAYTVTYDEEEDEYVVEGPKIEKMLGYTNLDSEKGFTFFQNFLKDAGILEELESLGIQEGDTVRMYGLSFDYYK